MSAFSSETNKSIKMFSWNR